MLKFKKQSPYARFPTLDTVLMIEEIIEKYSGEFNRTQLWKKLPKKVMWQTYVLVIDYLLYSNKIILDPKDGILVWTWDSKGISRLKEKGLIIK